MSDYCFCVFFQANESIVQHCNTKARLCVTVARRDLLHVLESASSAVIRISFMRADDKGGEIDLRISHLLGDHPEIQQPLRLFLFSGI